jgi:hypothetical protein
VLDLVKMALAAEKDDAMAQQGIADRGHRSRITQTGAGA